jgi:transcriptional regulator with XRE-family HTH domain
MRKGYAIGQLIRELRKAKGLTQVALSEMVGVSYQQIQKYEKSGDNISVERLKQVAHALGIPITVFFSPGAETVAEAPAAYGKMADDERLLLQLFRSVKDKKTRKAVLEFIGTMAAR